MEQPITLTQKPPRKKPRARGSVIWREDRSSWFFRYKGHSRMSKATTRAQAEKDAAEWMDELDSRPTVNDVFKAIAETNKKLERLISRLQ